MNDYQRMKGLLESLDDAEFVRFIERLYGVDVIIEDKKVVFVHPELGGSQPASARHFRASESEKVLSARESNRALWTKACALAETETDDAVRLQVAKSSHGLAVCSLVIGGTALLWNILEAALSLLF